jgi:N-acetylneuraminate synthase
MQRTGPVIVASMDEKRLQELMSSKFGRCVAEQKNKKKNKVTIDFAFATVCSIAKIEKGKNLPKISELKRPGTGKILN